MKNLTEKELVSFGNYLLSEERTESIKNNGAFEGSMVVKESLALVHDADLANWMDLENREVQYENTGDRSSE